MHVGLNLIYLVPGETGGMETYARELIRALREEQPDLRLTAFLSREAAADSAAIWTDIRCVTVPVRAQRRLEWVRGEQQLLPRLAAAQGIELLHSLASTAPVWGRFRRIVTIHDVLFRIYPETHRGPRALGMRILVPLAARRSERIIAPSSSTRDDLVRLLAVPFDKVDVIPHGVRPPSSPAPETVTETRARLGVGERPVALAPSAKRPHKNLGRLLEAISLIPADRRPVLLLPGYETPWEADLRRRAIELGIQPDTRFLGWVDDCELEALYAIASCVVVPSLYEGFGLPVLEAMSRGVPVACSDRGSLGEVAGGATRLFDPERPQAIADAIEVLLLDRAEADRLRALGRSRAADFTWHEAARQTFASYERALARGVPNRGKTEPRSTARP
jgi:glycosyltransferase involved in cell wall biosynthesis